MATHFTLTYLIKCHIKNVSAQYIQPKRERERERERETESEGTYTAVINGYIHMIWAHSDCVSFHFLTIAESYSL